MGESPYVGAFWLLAYEAVVNYWVTDDELSRDKMSLHERDGLERGLIL